MLSTAITRSLFQHGLHHRRLIPPTTNLFQNVISGSRTMAGGKRNPEHQRKNIKAAMIQRYQKKTTKVGGSSSPKSKNFKTTKSLSTKQILPKLPPKSLVPKRTEKAAASQPPPLFLTATASKYVFAANTLLDDCGIDPVTLFEEINSRPPKLFRSGTFEYINPKTVGFELPSPDIPQVAVLGRSNVGKSSLLNAMMRRDLAFCSKQPGRTQQVQYFGFVPNVTNNNNNNKNNHQGIEPQQVKGYLVDLPGYGYAEAPDKNVDEWQETTQEFLQERNSVGGLRRLLLLVDARRGASQLDRDVMAWMEEAEIAFSVVLTKVDRVSRPQLIRHANELCMRYHSQARGVDQSTFQYPLVHLTSSKTMEGIPELMSLLETEFLTTRSDDESQ